MVQDGDETLQAWTLIHIKDKCKDSSLSSSLFGFKTHTLWTFDYVGPVEKNCQEKILDLTYGMGWR